MSRASLIPGVTPGPLIGAHVLTNLRSRSFLGLHNIKAQEISCRRNHHKTTQTLIVSFFAIVTSRESSPHTFISPTTMSKSSIISFLLFFIASSSSLMVAATVTTAPTHHRVAAVDDNELWYPDYASSSGYDKGRCTNTPSSSLLKLTNYVSSGYTDRASCCRASFPGQQNNSYCSCMGGCSSTSSSSDDEDILSTVNDDIEFDMEIIYEKLVNNTQEFESFQEQETVYWEQLSSLLPTSW